MENETLLSGTQAGQNEPEILTNKEASSSVPKIRHIEGTPFATVKFPDGYKIVFGNQIIDPQSYETHEEAEDNCCMMNWPMILNACEVLIKHAIKEHELNNKQSNS